MRVINNFTKIKNSSKLAIQQDLPLGSKVVWPKTNLKSVKIYCQESVWEGNKLR